MTVNMNRVASIILGGGKGTRLYPLTVARCKPAISFGGRYRIIDVPISNSLNSNIHKIFVLTQFLSANLHRHILDTYRVSYTSKGFIELLGAEEKPGKKSWFEGPADAVRQNLEYFEETDVDYFLILSGDQLYNIDFQEMINFAASNNAELTIAALPIDEKKANRMGIMKVNKRAQITDFYEKPTDDKTLKRFRIKSPDALKKQTGMEISENTPYFGSMGIYVFKRETLFQLLAEDKREDFGKHLIPTQVAKGKTFAYVYNGYWEDIGTIESYFHANLALTKARPDLNCYDDLNSIYTCPYNLPGPKIFNSQIKDSIICEGAIVEAKEVSGSIIGTRSVLKKDSIIRNSYVVGNDFYARPKHAPPHHPSKISIGKRCRLENVILDKNVCLGNDVQLVNRKKLVEYDCGHGVYIRDGIIVVPRGSYLPDGFVL